MNHSFIDVTQANRRLNELIVGDFITGFETGDIWVLKLNKNSDLIAFHEMKSTKETLINEALKHVDKELFNCPDNQDISSAAILASITRRTIISASVDPEAMLTIIFDGNIEITIKSDTDVVDWQWCITRNAPNPYIEQPKLACFFKSEISIWDNG